MAGYVRTTADNGGVRYGITCTAPLVDVQVPEPAMPDLLLALVEELFRR